MEDVKEANLKKVEWVCTDCIDRSNKLNEHYRQCSNQTEMLKEEIKRLEERVANLQEALERNVAEGGNDDDDDKSSDEANFTQVIVSKIDNLFKEVELIKSELKTRHTGSGSSTKKTYAEKVKQGKNLLLIKSTIDTEKIIDKKMEMAESLKDIEIMNTKSTTKGNIVINFANEAQRDEAEKRIKDKVPNANTKKLGKLMPKIMICNVGTLENDSEVINTLIRANPCLESTPNIENKIKFLFKKPAAGNTSHFILKCDPDVRRTVHENHDKLKLEWGWYDVRDRYHVLTCSHCQGYGHMEKQCKKSEAAICGKCAGNHNTKNCNSEVEKCINCVRREGFDTRHRVNSRMCRVYDDEIARVAAITDHGYDQCY